jgi:hypothetical protein
MYPRQEERKTHERHEVGKDHENQLMKWNERQGKQIYCGE